MPSAVITPKEPGAVPRAGHEVTHMPQRSWCFSCVAGADDPHRKLDGYSGPPRVECGFRFLSSRVHLASPGLTIFNMMDRESQSVAAALSVKAACDLLVRLCWKCFGTTVTEVALPVLARLFGHGYP